MNVLHLRSQVYELMGTEDKQVKCLSKQLNNPFMVRNISIRRLTATGDEILEYAKTAIRDAENREPRILGMHPFFRWNFKMDEKMDYTLIYGEAVFEEIPDTKKAYNVEADTVEEARAKVMDMMKPTKFYGPFCLIAPETPDLMWTISLNHCPEGAFTDWEEAKTNPKDLSDVSEPMPIGLDPRLPQISPEDYQRGYEIQQEFLRQLHEGLENGSISDASKFEPDEKVAMEKLGYTSLEEFRAVVDRINSAQEAMLRLQAEKEKRQNYGQGSKSSKSSKSK